MKRNTTLITRSALIASLYVALTCISNFLGLASGVIQVRFSEALTVLPAFTFASVPGLCIGCFAANLITGCALWDVLLGTFATLLGALGTYFFGKTKVTAVIFPIISNTVIIPFVLRYVYGAPGAIPYFMLTVFIGEVISCGIFGCLLYTSLKKSGLFEKKY